MGDVDARARTAFRTLHLAAPRVDRGVRRHVGWPRCRRLGPGGESSGSRATEPPAEDDRAASRARRRPLSRKRGSLASADPGARPVRIELRHPRALVVRPGRAHDCAEVRSRPSAARGSRPIYPIVRRRTCVAPSRSAALFSMTRMFDGCRPSCSGSAGRNCWRGSAPMSASRAPAARRRHEGGRPPLVSAVGAGRAALEGARAAAECGGARTRMMLRVGGKGARPVRLVHAEGAPTARTAQERSRAPRRAARRFRHVGQAPAAVRASEATRSATPASALCASSSARGRSPLDAQRGGWVNLLAAPPRARSTYAASVLEELYGLQTTVEARFRPGQAARRAPRSAPRSPSLRSAVVVLAVLGGLVAASPARRRPPRLRKKASYRPPPGPRPSEHRTVGAARHARRCSLSLF